MSEQREALASILNAHHPTRGMRVSMGVTCACGYWTGSEPEQGKRPLPWGQDQLDLHRAAVVLAALTPGAADRVRAEEGGHEPRCQYVSPSPWGPTQCALLEGHAERHAYSPSEAQ